MRCGCIQPNYILQHFAAIFFRNTYVKSPYVLTFMPTFLKIEWEKKITEEIVATTSLPVDRLTATDCNANASAKMKTTLKKDTNLKVKKTSKLKITPKMKIMSEKKTVSK